MARNPLQEQLLKAGLVKKNQLDQVVRQQQKARTTKHALPKDEATDAVDAERLRAERAERDRQLEAQRKAERETTEREAQLRQIIAAHRVKAGDDSDYRFEHGGRIHSLRIADAQRGLLARGSLAVVSANGSYALVSRETAERLRVIDASVLCVDHANAEPAAAALGSDDEYYSRFQVPDDLVW